MILPLQASWCGTTAVYLHFLWKARFSEITTSTNTFLQNKVSDAKRGTLRVCHIKTGHMWWCDKMWEPTSGAWWCQLGMTVKTWSVETLRRESDFFPLIVSGLSLRPLLNVGTEQTSVVLIEGFHQAKKSSVTSQRRKGQCSGREQFRLTLWVSLVEGLHQCRAGLISRMSPQPGSQIPGSMKMITEDNLGCLQPILLIVESGPNEYCH